MQQAHDFLNESKILYELLLERNESDLGLITQFKNWSIQDVIGHLYLFNVAAIKTVDGPKSFEEFFITIVCPLVYPCSNFVSNVRILLSSAKFAFSISIIS